MKKKPKNNPKKQRREQKRKEKRRASQKARKGGPGIAYKAAMARIRREISAEPTPILNWGDMTEAVKPLKPTFDGEPVIEMSDETAENLRNMGEPEPNTYMGRPVVIKGDEGEPGA